jgi:hypothetical protein
MQSVRRKDLVYNNVSTSVLEHDEDFDAEQLRIGDKFVYKGTIDPQYTEHGLDVQWLYDDSSDRVGLIEYETVDRTVYSVLWYYDNPFGTFLQEPSWTCTGKTVWSLLKNEAYQDCLEDDFGSFIEMTLRSSTRVIFPNMLSNLQDHYYECSKCEKRTLSATSSCSSLKKVLFSNSSILFLDDSYVIYTPPVGSVITRLLPRGDDDQQAQERALPGEQEAQHPDQELQCPEQSQPM